MVVARVTLGDSSLPVGRLVFETDGRRSHSTFIYDQEWIENPRGFDLCPQMPRSTAPYHASSGGRESRKRDVLAGPFSDTAPDSWGRKLMRRVLGEGTTEFDFLVSCDDTARQGALRFLQEDGEPFPRIGKAVPRLGDIEDLRNIAQRFERDPAGADQDALDLVGAAGTPGGARPKANVLDGDNLWLAKFTSINDTWPVERLEVATLKLAALVGIRAPKARLELAASQHPIALISRFDRRQGGRVPYISAKTALGRVGNAGGYYTDIADIIRVISAAPTEDLLQIWLRMVFGILITNTDDHLKNHGFIYAGRNLWRLSPVFDINPQPRRLPQMETGTSPIHGHEPNIAAAIESAEFFDIDQDKARILARDVARNINTNWRSELRRQGLSGSALSACAPAFEHERLEFALGL
ncbi:type II toxin-antitoxin system HipA family toxin [uncultured Pelagimonas sp.]|uniref:type II toxin-antitoxin system HipA family toxin n=1 Tax=uncultured Pelagimonas sp. TaxID=1618102 RepID=UPI002615D4A2|nr:type II toxin-antitoxin system HipA family toxin [uncultured Pelagimonas sp.]